MPTIKLSNGTVYPVSDDFQGIEPIKSIRQVRHFFDHSTMRQSEAVYPVDPALRCVGEADADEWEIVEYLL